MIEIDGSLGEGGGQVLRSALCLSIITRVSMRIFNIRANRSKPGLQAQHLKAVDAASAISHAAVQRAYMGSQDLIFEPGEIRTGRYKFEISTAGSNSLVLQTILVPLSLGNSASTVIITGGTHVPWAPCFHYIEQQWLPFMNAIGFQARVDLSSAGFYPQGGGRIDATIRPAAQIQPLQLEERGRLLSIEGISAVANLDLSIAERQKRQSLHRLLPVCPNTHIKIVQLPSRFKGTLLFLLARFKVSGDEIPHSISAQACYYALGEKQKPAERVADEAADALLGFLEGDGLIDQYLADQLLLPLAFASGASRFCTPCLTQHLLTNAQIIHQFTPAHIEIDGEQGQPAWVNINPNTSTQDNPYFRLKR
jgi:RNA 3'-terminal phosphate cyclase (ATP)